DLREKFVQGAAAGVDPGATGGAIAKTTSGHNHDTFSGVGSYGPVAGPVAAQTSTDTDAISDIRPPYYDVAFIMKS
ncbi:unnamed protein product, partial [marine sediment metagenome]